MANSWKDIIITPNRSSSVADPKIEFRGANVTVNSAITIQAYPASNGMLSFEGSAGQLFSITNDLTGSIFSVNDVSGIPSIEVFANGQINFAEFGGSVVIGNTATFVINAISATDITVAGNLTVSGTTTYINSTALNIGDNIITLNADLPAATAPTQNTGIEVNRGSSANVQFMWDETNDRWTTNGQPLAITSLVAAGAASGITTLGTGNTTISGFANVTGSIQGGSSLLIAGSASGITTLGAGNTTITGFANVITTGGTLAGLSVTNTAVGIYLVANAASGSYNGLVAAGDNLLYFSNNVINNGNLVIGAHSDRTGGYGVRFTGNTYNINIVGNTFTVTANSTITGFANVTGSIQGGSTLTIAGAASGITTLGAGNTTITGFANVSTTLQVGTNTATFGTAAYIVANGNVGIGTTSPGTKLQLNNATSVGTGPGSMSGISPILYVDNGSAAGGSVVIKSHTPGAGNIVGAYRFVGTPDGTNYNWAGMVGIADVNSAVSTLAFYNSASNSSGATSSERMRITSAGTVGIGTDTPRGTLSLGTSSASLSTQTLHFGYTVADFYGWRLNSTNTPTSFAAGTLSIERGTTTAWVSDFVINNSGNVGIGTTSPALKFAVSNSGAAGLEIDPTAVSSAPVIQAYNRSGAAYVQMSFDALQFVWRPSGSELMRLDSVGDLGIGTTNPVGKLSVEMGNASSSGGTAGLSAWDNTYALFGVTGTTTSSAVGIGYNSTTGGSLISLTPSTAWRRMNYLASEHRFYNSAAEALQIDSGNRLILYAPMVAWNVTTPGQGRGSLHIGTASTTTDAGGSITFEARDATAGTAQAGIYLNSGGGFGTRMYFATTNNYGSGSITAMTIDHVGIITANRDSFRAPSFRDSADSQYFLDPDSTGTALQVAGSAAFGTTSPGARLDVRATNPTRGILAIYRNNAASSQTGAQIQLSQNGIDDWSIGQPAGESVFAMWTGRNTGANGTEVFRISSGGIAQITSSNDYQLTLSGAGTSWAGILFSDVSNNDTIYYNGSTRTFSIGGTGGTAANKMLHVHGGVTIGSSLQGSAVDANSLRIEGSLGFGSATRQMVNLWSTTYGIGVQNSTQYFRTDGRFSWFRGGSHVDTENSAGSGGTVAMTLDSSSNLIVTGEVQGTLFRDTANSSCLVDPSSTSVLTTIRANTIQHGAGTGAGNDAILLNNSTYTRFCDPAGTVKLWLGGTLTDPGNYYNNSSHIFRNTLDGNLFLIYGNAARRGEYDASNGALFIRGDTGGWAMGTYFVGSSGTNRGGFGALGGADALTNFWIGTAYDSPAVNIFADGRVVAIGSHRAPIFYDSAEPSYFLDMNASDSGLLRGTLTFNDYGAGIVGLYDSTKFQLVYAMGAAYKGALNGANVTGGYGLWWSYPSAGGPAATLTSHGLLCIVNGSMYAQLDASTQAITDMRAPEFIVRNSTSFKFTAGTTNINVLSGNGKEIFVTNDSFLRVNQSSTFSSGTWFGGTLVRADGFYAGSNGGTTNSRVHIAAGTYDGSRVIYLNGGDGSISAAGNITAYSSDVRLKTNIAPISNAIDKVMSIGGYTFDWVDEVDELGFKPDLKTDDAGVLAQEIQAVLPQAVAPAPFDWQWDEERGEHASKSGENYLTVRYERIVPLLIEAIKELKSHINILEEEIDTLKRG